VSPFYILFHGGEILVLLAGGLFGIGIFTGMLVWAFSGPARPWTIPAVYLLVSLSISIPEIFTDNFFGLSVMLSFPWSVLLIFVSVIVQRDIGLYWQIPAIVFNAIVVFMVARYRRP
jgi:hypothetical protein